MRLPLVFVIFSVTLSISYGYPHTENRNVKTGVIDQSFEDTAAYPSEHQTESTISHLIQEDPSFYPSFPTFDNPPLGHSRPFFFQQQEGAYSQRAVSPFQQLSYDTYRGGGEKYVANEESRSGDLLGSGNFGVISGGTFYNDNDGESTGFESRFENLYQNGHGAPSIIFRKLAKASRAHQQQQEPFANFRDFADINTPSYSQYVVVYTNKNTSNHNEDSNNKRPKNIIEQLALLDQESGTTTSAPQKKLSKSKRKLSLLQPEKKFEANLAKKEVLSASDLGEPLLALS